VDLLLEYTRDIGLDGIVVTDHDEIDESLRAAGLAPEFGLVGVPGVETPGDVTADHVVSRDTRRLDGHPRKANAHRPEHEAVLARSGAEGDVRAHVDGPADGGAAGVMAD
jgi:predicted metal-dependent phosphoesterase TrpH